MQKKNGLYLVLILVLIGAYMSLIKSMGGEDLSAVAVPLVSRDAIVCEACNKFRDVLFETTCATCLGHNLSTNLIMTLYVNNNAGLAVSLLKSTSPGDSLIGDDSGYFLDCPFALDSDLGDGLLESKGLDSKDLSGYASEDEGLPESKGASVSEAIIKCVR